MSVHMVVNERVISVCVCVRARERERDEEEGDKGKNNKHTIKCSLEIFPLEYIFKFSAWFLIIVNKFSDPEVLGQTLPVLFFKRSYNDTFGTFEFVKSLDHFLAEVSGWFLVSALTNLTALPSPLVRSSEHDLDTLTVFSSPCFFVEINDFVTAFVAWRKINIH